jgi:uncharacterized protein
MLEIRPNCELCDKDLAAEALDACICSYECTFCRECVESVLQNVCPNCGGGFSPRPIRPSIAHREGVSLANQVASDTRVNTKRERAEIVEFSESLKDTLPHKR